MGCLATSCDFPLRLMAAVSVRIESMWSSVASTLSLALALAGPAIVAFVSSHAMGAAPAFVVHIVSVASIAVIVLVAFATALRLDGFTFRKLGFEGMSWS